MNPTKQHILIYSTMTLLNQKVSEWISTCILVPRPEGFISFMKVNSVTKLGSFSIPIMDYCIDSIGNAKYVTKFHLSKGFWRAPLTEI